MMYFTSFNYQEVHVRTLSDSTNRRSFIGGSDARIIMGDDEAALLRLWREKRGEVEPKT
jgi:predicted phage-related endonuclease